MSKEDNFCQIFDDYVDVLQNSDKETVEKETPNDLILKILNEIRQEIFSLRKEVNEMKSILNKIEDSTVKKDTINMYSEIRRFAKDKGLKDVNDRFSVQKSPYLSGFLKLDPTLLKI